MLSDPAVRLPRMDPALAALMGMIFGVAGGAGGQIVDRRHSARRDRDARNVALLEEAANALSRQRRQLQTQYSLWQAGLPIDDARVQEADRGVTEAIEDVWSTDNLLVIHFGADAEVTSAYRACVDNLDALRRLCRRTGFKPAQQHQQEWMKAAQAAVLSHRRFTQHVREVATQSGPHASRSLLSRPRLRAPRRQPT